MVAAGYNPYGAVEVLQMIQEQHQVRPIEFLSTHCPFEKLYLDAGWDFWLRA
jgi:predicted Zn-dependent protease